MSEATIRELRNHGGRVIERVERGERVTITRNGEPVAELRPLRPRGLKTEVVIERFRRLPHVDHERFRDDIDSIVDQSLE